MIRFVLIVVVTALFASAGLVLTDGGRNWLRGAKAEVTHRIAVSQLDGVTRQGDIPVIMPDGTALATDVYFPATPGAAPTILMRLPYGKTRFAEVRHWIEALAPRGYNIVVQDMRGRWGSEGIFAPWPNAGPDGVATLDWITQQGWSDGQVATIGCSAMGESQIALARAGHPAHRAMVPMGAGGAIGTAGGLHQFFGIFEGGVPALASAFGWFVTAGGKTPEAMTPPEVDYGEGVATLPIRAAVSRFRADATDYEALLDGLTDPEFGAAYGYLGAEDTLAIPALYIDTWYDQSVNATFEMARTSWESAARPHVVIGPGTHCNFTGPFAAGGIGDVAIAPEAALDMTEIAAEFLDHQLLGAPAPDLPPYRVFVMNGNRWLDSHAWPPAEAAQTRFYLGAQTLSQDPSRGSAIAAYTSDPANPVPTIGGAICCTGNPDQQSGPVDQSPNETRDDLLVYTSAPLESAMVIAGPISANLHVATSSPDADLMLRLTDVDPDGRSILIQEGSLRLRYRDGFNAARMMRAEEITQVSVQMRDIAWHLEPGHRLRLHIASTNYPRLARNMQGGGDPHLEGTPNPARISVHAGPETPSFVQVYVLGD